LALITPEAIPDRSRPTAAMPVAVSAGVANPIPTPRARAPNLAFSLPASGPNNSTIAVIGRERTPACRGEYALTFWKQRVMK
jgi:hypothetical protein